MVKFEAKPLHMHHIKALQSLLLYNMISSVIIHWFFSLVTERDRIATILGSVAAAITGLIILCTVACFIAGWCNSK